MFSSAVSSIKNASIKSLGHNNQRKQVIIGRVANAQIHLWASLASPLATMRYMQGIAVVLTIIQRGKFCQKRPGANKMTVQRPAVNSFALDQLPMKHAANIHMPKSIPVLMYHHVRAEPGSLSVTARQFESQIKGLARAGYSSVSADEFAHFLQSGTAPKKSVLITFDDGYLDNWVYAHPVLQRYGMSAVLFAVSGLIGEGHQRSYNGEGRALPECLPHHKTKTLMFGPERDRVMLRWSEIEAMVQAGTFEIHSHTHTHIRWDLHSKSNDEKCSRLLEDLLQSKNELTMRLGDASAHLCWPQGYFDADYIRIARQAGFRFLYTTDARGMNKVGNDPGHIYRFAVRNRAYSWLRQRIWLATHPTLAPLYNRWKARSDSRKKQRQLQRVD